MKNNVISEITSSIIGLVILISPLLNSSYEIWSKSIIHFLTVFLLFIYFFNLKKNGFIKIKELYFIFYILVIFVIYLIINTENSKIKFNSKLELHNWINYAIIFFIIVYSEINIKKILKFIFILGSILIISALYQKLFLKYIPYSFMINPSVFANYIIMLIPLYFYFYKENSESYLYLFILCLLIICLILTNSIASVMSLLVGFFLIKYKKTKGIILCLIAVSIFLVIKSIYDLEIFNRIRWWLITMNIIKDYPLFGTGLGSFEYVYNFYKDPGLASKFAHNFYLQFFSEAGFFGILFFLIIIIYVLRKTQNDFIKICIVSNLVVNFFDYSFFIPANSILFWSLLGIGLKFRNNFEEKRINISDKFFLYFIYFLLVFIYFNSVFRVYLSMKYYDEAKTLIDSGKTNEDNSIICRLKKSVEISPDLWISYKELSEIYQNKYRNTKKISYFIDSIIYMDKAKEYNQFLK